MRITTGPSLSDILDEIERLREAVQLTGRQGHTALAAMAGGLKLLADQAVSLSSQIRIMEERLAALESAAAKGGSRHSED